MKIKYLCLFAVMLLISACASNPNKPQPKATEGAAVNCDCNPNAALNGNTAKQMELAEALTFTEQFSNLSADAQKQLLIKANQTLAIQPTDLTNRFKIALMYGLPSSHVQDYLKAQTQLQSILQQPSITPGQTALARLLFDYVNTINKANKNSRDDERRIDNILQKNENLLNKLEASQLKVESTQQKLDAAQQKLIAAQQKIDELKNIEKSMGQREVKK